MSFSQLISIGSPATPTIKEIVTNKINAYEPIQNQFHVNVHGIGMKKYKY